MKPNQQLMTLSMAFNEAAARLVTDGDRKYVGSAFLLSAAGTAIKTGGISKEEFLSAASSCWDIAEAVRDSIASKRAGKRANREVVK